MITTVNEFCGRVESNMAGLLDELLQRTNRNNPKEREAWVNSLPALSRALAQAQEYHPPLGGMHLNLGHVTIEYRLPAASAWCDAVLLGENDQARPQALIIELKHWDTTGDQPGIRECLVLRRNLQEHHPSDQVKGYVEYCRNFHSAIVRRSASVEGCVYFTQPTTIQAYRLPPNAQLTASYPVFSLFEERDARRFSSYIAGHLIKENAQFAFDFARGHYEQDRNILVQVARSLRESKARPFVLLDEQRRGFALCLNAIESIDENAAPRHVIIVKGPYGSGKSALAVNLWIECAEKYAAKGNIVFATTSSSQSTNWQSIFERNSQHSGARFLTITSNNFNPGLNGKMVSTLRDKGYEMDYHQWQACLDAYVAEGHHSRVPDFNHHISIVDEAHSLINPETHNIGFSSGWCVQAGPQAYHIIRATRISVFLMHTRQSYRDNETTSIDDIKDYADRLGAEVTEISLEGQQFRCGGSTEYLEWIEAVLAGKRDIPDVNRWRSSYTHPDNPFRFELVDTPAALDERLILLHERSQTVRLVSSYSVAWETSKDPSTGKKWARPSTYERYMRQLSPEQCDFRIPYRMRGDALLWTRPWNFAPNEDYTLFIQAPVGSMMHDNPLSEVGCPYVLRGFDYDYLGVLWLDDIVWRGAQWEVALDHVHETAIKSTLGDAKKERKKKVFGGPAHEKLLERVVRAYLILLTRAIKGVFVYIHDQETREHVRRLLQG